MLLYLNELHKNVFCVILYLEYVISNQLCQRNSIPKNGDFSRAGISRGYYITF